MSKYPDKVRRKRWLTAHEQEIAGVERTEDVREWLRVRRQTWPNLMNYLKDIIPPGSYSRTLDIGGGPTSIFLAIAQGERVMVDPVYEHLFETYPFMKDVEEYRGVQFLSCPIEEAKIEKPFDLIFSINALDHVGELALVMKRIDELLAPSGKLVVLVDCYADKWVRNIVRFFDADVPHPHHFISEDILALFSHYTLLKQDNEIFHLLGKPAFLGEESGIPVYRIDRFIGRMRKDLRDWGKSKDLVFAVRFFICYGLSIVVGLLRRKERPVHPLKKQRLFIFQKHS